MSEQPSLINEWQPPSNYKQISSKIEGITIFAPAPKEKKEDKPVTFKCPNCGATTNYDVNAGGIACEHCGYVKETKTSNIGTRAKEFEFTLETINNAEHGWGVNRKEMHCDKCGAELAVEKDDISAICPFCGSNKVNLRTAPSDNLRPRFLIPFKISPKETKTLARNWLGKGWFHPSELKINSIIDRFTGLYLSFWTFDATIHARWDAEVGYEYTERYFQDGEWKTRTKIRWRWENGNVTTYIDDLLLSGNSKISRLILEKIYPFNLTDLVTYTPDFLAGWQAQSYDINLIPAWEDAKKIMRDQSKKDCHHNINSSHVRNFSMKADFSDESWRYVLLPVYLAAYTYENQIYQVMINGQTGSVAGQKPVAWWKIWLAIAGILAPGTFLGLIGLPLLMVGGIGMIPIILGIILFIIGIIISISIYKQAVSSEAS